MEIELCCRGTKTDLIGWIENHLGSDGSKEDAEHIYDVLRNNDSKDKGYIVVLQNDNMLTLFLEEEIDLWNFIC